MNEMLFKAHLIEQLVLPSEDSEQWVAYVVLKQRYPNLSYWSYDSWSCHALIDAKSLIIWDGTKVYNFETKEVIEITEKAFNHSTSREIIDVWTRINKETSETKQAWVKSYMTKGTSND